MKVLSIVFSFRNEEKNIPELIKRVSSVLKNLNDWKYELIFVNDDSSDYSEKILEESQKSHPECCQKLLNIECASKRY